MSSNALGPYGRRIMLSAGEELVLESGKKVTTANTTLILWRVAFPIAPGKTLKDRRESLIKWAVTTNLGQSGVDELRKAVSERRKAALRGLASLPTRPPKALKLQRSERSSQVARVVQIKPEWRIAIGLGDKAGIAEIGVALHGTYGWPIIPASALKGIARHWAKEIGEPDEKIARILGRGGGKGEESTVGDVIFLDALPGDEYPVKVEADILTPHYKTYYQQHATEAERKKNKNPTEGAPPAGWKDPEPLTFLTFGSTQALIAGLVGPANDVSTVAKWLNSAFNAVGIGAKTASGYGYASIQNIEELMS